MLPFLDAIDRVVRDSYLTRIGLLFVPEWLKRYLSRTSGRHTANLLLLLTFISNSIVKSLVEERTENLKTISDDVINCIIDHLFSSDLSFLRLGAVGRGRGSEKGRAGVERTAEERREDEAWLGT